MVLSKARGEFGFTQLLVLIKTKIVFTILFYSQVVFGLPVPDSSTTDQLGDIIGVY